MNAAVAEFLNENAGRAYPLAEDSMPLDVLTDIQLDTDVILDFRAATREGFSHINLEAIVGPNATGLPAQHSSSAGNYMLYFKVSGLAPRTIGVSIPVASEFPVIVDSRVDDPDYPGFDLLSISVTVGSGLLEIPDATYLYLRETAPLEPALTIRLANSVVDSIQVIRQGQPDFFVGGDVVLRGGYSIETRWSGSRFEITPVLGGGELGRYEGIPGDTLGCGGVLRSLSAVRPDDKGRLFITGSNGILVENFPKEYRIKITASRSEVPAEVRC